MTVVSWGWTVMTASIWLIMGAFVWNLDLPRVPLWAWLPHLGRGLFDEPQNLARIPLILYLGASVDAAMQRRHGRRIGMPPDLRRNYRLRLVLVLLAIGLLARAVTTV